MTWVVEPPLRSLAPPGLPAPPPLGAPQPMLRRADRIASHCSCGQELAADSRHFLCEKHRQQVLREVGRRFGSHRYGGRYSHYVEDFVQECYEKLLKPGGLDRFQPQAECARADAFSAWLWRVVEFHCHNKLAYLQCRPTGEPAEEALEQCHVMTPEQAFARKCLRELVALAVADVEAKWKADGLKKALRFEVFLAFLNDEDDDYEQAQALLGVSNVNAKQIKHKLAKQILQAARWRVRDTLYLEPGLSQDEIERRIDVEIQALLDAAFPSKAENQELAR